MAFKLNVNGRSTTVDVLADTPLLWVIRDVLNLKGTKYGCGIGQCGACTVHLNGSAVRSCQTPVSAAANQRITTLEGQMMSAAALLAKKTHPTDKDIDSAMNGNLCRCGTYLRIRQAIHRAAEITTNASARSVETASVNQ